MTFQGEVSSFAGRYARYSSAGATDSLGTLPSFKQHRVVAIDDTSGNIVWQSNRRGSSIDRCTNLVWYPLLQGRIWDTVMA